MALSIALEAPPKEAPIRAYGDGDHTSVHNLPIPIHSYGDAGRYLGSGITITKDPETGIEIGTGNSSW